MNKNLMKNNYQFDCFSKSYLQFENDFYEYSNINIPLTFLADDIIKYLSCSEKEYFRLTKDHSKDKKDHYFLFKKVPHKDNENVKSIEYLEHRYTLEEI